MLCEDSSTNSFDLNLSDLTRRLINDPKGFQILQNIFSKDPFIRLMFFFDLIDLHGFSEFFKEVIKRDIHYKDDLVSFGQYYHYDHDYRSSVCDGVRDSKDYWINSWKRARSPCVSMNSTDVYFLETNVITFQMLLGEDGYTELHESSSNLFSADEDLFAIPLFSLFKKYSKFALPSDPCVLYFCRERVRSTIIAEFKQWWNEVAIGRRGSILERVDLLNSKPSATGIADYYGCLLFCGSTDHYTRNRIRYKGDILCVDTPRNRRIFCHLSFDPNSLLHLVEYHYLNQEFLTMSGIESNPGPYDTDDEYYDDFETVPLDETTLNLIVTDSFKLENLEELLKKVLSMKTIEDCLDLVRMTGSITDRVDIYPWKPESMIHFVGLLKFSINITINGGNVHLIEGCNSSFRRFIGDLDILWSHEGKYHISDLTYNSEASSPYSFGSRRYTKGKVFDEKMLKLSYILQDSEVNRSVLRFDYDYEVCPEPIEFNIDVPSSSEDEFDCTEKMIDFFQNAKISDYSTHRLNLLQTLSESLESHNNLGKYKHRSDLKVQEIFHERIREHISENKSGYGELIGSLGDNVFKSHFDLIEKMSIKPSIKFPRFKVRSEDFDEDKEIMRLLSKSKGFPFEIYKALAGLESNVIVKKNRYEA